MLQVHLHPSRHRGDSWYQVKVCPGAENIYTKSHFELVKKNYCTRNVKLTVISRNLYLFASFWSMKFFFSDNQSKTWKRFLIIFGALVLFLGMFFWLDDHHFSQLWHCRRGQNMSKRSTDGEHSKESQDTPFLRSDHRLCASSAAL